MSKDLETNQPVYEETLAGDELPRPQSIRHRTTSAMDILRMAGSQEDLNNEPVPLTAETVTRLQSYEAQGLERSGWWNLWGMEDFGSELLENNGAVARDHMANERTFLSWIRTSMAMATAGVGVTQLFKLAQHNNEGYIIAKMGKPVGVCFIIIGVMCVFMGTHRFFRTQHLLKEDRYPPAKLTVSVLVFLVFAICVVTLAAVLYSHAES